MWLVKHKEGSCALKHQVRMNHPPEGAFSVPTMCGHFVVLPHGYDQGVPTCDECVAIAANNLHRALGPKKKKRR